MKIEKYLTKLPGECILVVWRLEMKIILLHSHYEQEHLEQIIEEMKILGTPSIKAIWMECWNSWVALEGCHRLRAAYVLGLIPEIEEINYDENILAYYLELDWQDDCAITCAIDGAHRRENLEFQ